MRTTSPLIVVAALAVLAPAAARADGAGEARLREALRTATTQLRALEDERARWQATEAEQRKEIEKLRAQLATAAKRPAPVVKRDDPEVEELKQLRQRLADQEGSATKLSSSLAQCQAGEKTAAEAARDGEGERARLTADVAILRERLAATEARNTRLYGLGKEMLDWISREGVYEASEPLLGLKRVELENVAQNYEDKLLEARSKPGGTP